MAQTIKEYVTYRLSDGYKLPHPRTGKIARQKDFLRGGLAKDLSIGKALDLGKIGSQHLYNLPSTALAERYYNLLFCLPEEAESLAMHFDQLSLFQGERVLQALDLMVHSMHEEHSNVDKFMVVQHIAQREPYGYYFSQTLPQMHFHVMSYAMDSLDSSQSLFEETSQFSDERIHEFVRKEPSSRVIYDWLKKDFEDFTFDTDKARIGMYKTSLNNLNYKGEVRLLQKVFQSWKNGWERIFSNYTDFELSKDKRYIPIDPTVSIKRLNKMLQEEDTFSKESMQNLITMLDNMQADYSLKAVPRYFKGINGTLGWLYDFKKGERKCFLAPKTEVYLCDEFKNWHLVDDLTHVVYKNREKRLSEEQANFVFEERRQMYQRIAANKAAYYTV